MTLVPTRPGLSENTISFTVLSEKGPWSGRLFCNFRDQFLDRIPDGSGPPCLVASRERLDVSPILKPTANLAFALQAINLTDENAFCCNLLATGTERHFSSAINPGRRFQLGVRHKTQSVVAG